jgi:hypothetical protein
MNVASIIILFTLPSVVPDISITPEISVVRTWNDLVHTKPQSFSSKGNIRIGISRKTCPIYGGVTVYCLVDGLEMTKRRWPCQIGLLPLRVERDKFSVAFWGVLDSDSIALVGEHKCEEGPNLFMFPVIVTKPSDACLHPKFNFVKNAFGFQLDAATKSELTIHIFGPDDTIEYQLNNSGSTGLCKIEVTDKIQQPWLHFNMPGDPQNKYCVAFPAWDTLLPMPLPKKLDQKLPSLFPDDSQDDLILTYEAGKLKLKSKFPLLENPAEKLLVRWWRGGTVDYSKTGIIQTTNILKTSVHEYTIELAPSSEIKAGEKLGVQILYNELGWLRGDPNTSVLTISNKTQPRLPVVSNRVDFVADEK